MLYSAFTYYCGFKVNSGEYKLMGLAPYGRPKYTELIKNNLIDIKQDGTFRLNLEYFDFVVGLKMINRKFEKLFGHPTREKESPISQFYMDMAASIQKVTEEIIIKLAKSLQKDTNAENLCLAGGVALNCVANGILLKENIFKNIWIQPAAGDAGGAMGAALVTWFNYLKNNRVTDGENDSIQGTYLGPEYSNEDIELFLNENKIKFTYLDDHQLNQKLVDNLCQEKVIGWFNGRMEFGPRALGSRSIIGDARSSKMQSIMNLKIKKRESFRPFAPAVLFDDIQEYFEFDNKSSYMLFTTKVKSNLLKELSPQENNLVGIEKLKVQRSSLPAITHIDNSARIQTVHSETNSKFYNLLKEFKNKTNCSVLINTSFNIRSEPIVCTPYDAYRCFMKTEMDILVLGNYFLEKKDQPSLEFKKDWHKIYELD